MSEIKITRPEKKDVFLFLAWTLKELSCDANTKVGCVITNTKNRILGMGYNGPPREVDNEDIPNYRPKDSTDKSWWESKYPWYIHAEKNAVTNCTHKPIDYDGGGIAYVTHYCCFDCTMHLWQNGVREVYQIDNTFASMPHQQEELKQDLSDRVGMKLHVVKPDFSFAMGLVEQSNRMGFVYKELDYAVETFRDMIC